MPRSRLGDLITEIGKNKNNGGGLAREYKALESSLKKYNKAKKKKADKDKKNKAKDNAWIKKQKEKDKKNGVTRSAKEYRKLAVERRETQAYNRKVNAVMRTMGVSRQTAEELIIKKEKAEKSKQRAKALKLSQWKKQLGVKNLDSINSAFEQRKIAYSAKNLKNKGKSIIDDGRNHISFDFSKIDASKINKERVTELQEAGLKLDDAVATAWLETQGPARQTFRDPALPGGKPRGWTQAELYRARAMAIDAQVQEEEDIKKGILPPHQAPQDMMGKGNEAKFFSWVGAQNENKAVYLPTTSRQRSQYSSGALMSSFDKALSHYLSGNSRLKKLIMNKMAGFSDLKGTLSYSPLITNQDITSIFEGYRIAIAAQDDDAISREIMSLAEAVGVDLNAELDGKSVVEAIYFRNGPNPYADQYEDLDFSINKNSYTNFVDKSDLVWVEKLNKYKKMKGKTVLR